mgnify:CR=1 FL=1
MTVYQWLPAVLALHWEWLATLLALAFILLALGQYWLCWVFAMVVAMVHALGALAQESWLLLALNLAYVLIAGSGLWRWGSIRRGARVRQLTVSSNIYLGALLLAMSLVSGFWADYYGLAVHAYAEAFMLWSMLAFLALLAGGYRECWLALLLSEGVAVALALEAGEQHSASLHCFYLSLALAGTGIWARAGVAAPGVERSSRS